MRLISLHTAGNLGFYLNGAPCLNGSTVLRTDIGEDDAALQCTTDSDTCCTNENGEVRAGEFYFPNGTIVPRFIDSGSSGYYRDRGSRLIRLNRQSPNGVITGQFRCEIPNSMLMDFYITIGMYVIGM